MKLIDVYPGDAPNLRPEPSPGPANAVVMGGYQQLVRGDPFRAKFRKMAFIYAMGRSWPLRKL